MKFWKQKDGQERAEIHPIWVKFIQFCQKLGYGEIAKLKIQDKLPVCAEIVREKIKFANHNK